MSPRERRVRVRTLQPCHTSCRPPVAVGAGCVRWGGRCHMGAQGLTTRPGVPGPSRAAPAARLACGFHEQGFPLCSHTCCLQTHGSGGNSQLLGHVRAKCGSRSREQTPRQALSPSSSSSGLWGSREKPPGLHPRQAPPQPHAAKPWRPPRFALDSHGWTGNPSSGRLDVVHRCFRNTTCPPCEFSAGVSDGKE